MPLKLCAEGKMVTACLIGEIDHHGAGKLREEIDTMLERNHPDTLILDFREVTFMDSSGIGLVMGLSLIHISTGAKTVKLKYGHRGANQPVRDLAHDKTCITSQNHGYAVQGDTVDPAVGEVSHVNANDNTVEGMRYKNKSCFTVQFHPEASAGPQDTSYLFDEFIAMMKKEAK